MEIIATDMHYPFLMGLIRRRPSTSVRILGALFFIWIWMPGLQAQPRLAGIPQRPALATTSTTASGSPRLVRSETLSWDDASHAVAVATEGGAIYGWIEGNGDEARLRLERTDPSATRIGTTTDVPCTWLHDLSYHDGTLLAVCSRYGQLYTALFDQALQPKSDPIAFDQELMSAAAGWDGEAFLVLHSMEDQIFAERLGIDGTLIETARPFITPLPAPNGTQPAQQYPQIVEISDEEIFVIWQEGAAYTGICRITCPIPARDGIIRFGRWRAGALVEESLQTIDPPKELLFAPTAAWDGERILLGWFSQFEGVDVELHMLESDDVLTPVATLTDVAYATYPQPVLRIAALTSGFVAVWESPTISDGVLLPWSKDIRGTTVVDGQPESMFDLATSSRNEWLPFLHPTSTGFQLLFLDDDEEGTRSGRLVMQTWRTTDSAPRRRTVSRP